MENGRGWSRFFEGLDRASDGSLEILPFPGQAYFFLRF
jgi:hypothetical protein